MTALKAIPQQEFQKRFQQWQHHWANCIVAEGEYFEGDLSVRYKYAGVRLAVVSFRELHSHILYLIMKNITEFTFTLYFIRHRIYCLFFKMPSF